jgi:hypothetical protein
MGGQQLEMQQQHVAWVAALSPDDLIVLYADMTHAAEHLRTVFVPALLAAMPGAEVCPALICSAFQGPERCDGAHCCVGTRGRWSFAPCAL